MELKDFIRETFVQISKGIEEANEELTNSTAIINPNNVYVNSDSRQNYGRLGTEKNYDRIVESVTFDIAVSASDKSDAGGKFAIKVGSIELGSNGSKSESNNAESRIKFKIPMVFPSSYSN